MVLVALVTISACGGGGNATPIEKACETLFRIDDELARGDISHNDYIANQIENVFDPILELYDSPGLTSEESAVAAGVKKLQGSRELPEADVRLIEEEIRSACRTLLGKQ